MNPKAWLQRNRRFLLTIFLLFVFRSSFADQYYVPSGSMEPAILPGDRIVVNKMAYDLKVPFTSVSLGRIGEPQRGDIVVFTSPADGSTNLVKRLIGLPGDHIRIIDGVAEVNGRPEETARFVQRIPELARSENLDFIVPPDRYFFMGDNRDNSSDSRMWGFAHRSAIKGQALGVFFSLDWSHGIIPSLRTERSGVRI